jgi:hypothetical protein
MAPMHKIALSKAGIVSTIPSAIRSGPMARGRLGIIDMYCYSGVSQIETLISNLWQGTPTGKLLNIALDDTALELGMSDTWHIDNLKHGLLYATNKSWIQHVLEFTVENNICLHLDQNIFKLHRTNDVMVMESAVAVCG